MPVVSVIMPTYNGVRFVGQAIESVLAQTYPHWDLTVVDDGSTDGTPIVVSRFEGGRVRCVRQQNKGLSAARNTGIRVAHGEYLCFLDQDDEWYPEFLNTCVEALARNCDPQIVGVYTSHVHIDEAGQVLPQPGNGVVPPDELPDRLIAENFFPPHVVMVRADVVREVGLFDETLRLLGDKDLWFRITRRYTMLGIPEPLAKYRVYPGSMSTNAENMLRDRKTLLTKHFGSDEGDPTRWSRDKRLAYSCGYRESALAYMRQGEMETGWSLLMRGAGISPGLLTEERTYSAMAYIRQPRGYCGRPDNLDVHAVGTEILSALEGHLRAQGEPLAGLRRAAAGSACLAFAGLADRADDWRLARHYIWQAYVACPGLLASNSGVLRAMRLVAGRRLWSVLRRFRGLVQAGDAAG